MYDAYGVETDKDDDDENPFRYCGEYYDSELDGIYLRNRYYAPKLSRFMTEDPIKDGLNWYVYCEGNPVKWVDPSGLENVYIFYGIEHGENGGFNDRANKEAKKWKEKGRSVKCIPITSEEEFMKEWNGMNNGDDRIEKVSLYFHSNPNTLIIDYTNNEYIRVFNVEEKQNITIRELDKKSIETICLYACNSTHQDYQNNIAFTFFTNQNVQTVYGWDGSMRWSYLAGKPILANDQHYFTTWLIDDKNRKPYGLVKYSRYTSGYVTYPRIWESR